MLLNLQHTYVLLLRERNWKHYLPKFNIYFYSFFLFILFRENLLLVYADNVYDRK